MWPAAMLYTHLYSVHPYWWKRQVLYQMWPSGSQHASKKECRQDIHSGFETHEEGHTKSKTGAISGSTKWTLVQTKIFRKKKICLATTSFIKSKKIFYFSLFIEFDNIFFSFWTILSFWWRSVMVSTTSCNYGNFKNWKWLESQVT